MKINKDVIGRLNPCKDRFDNYIKFYGDKEFTRGEFMGLKNITQEDKMWVAFRLIPEENIKLAAADIAESVLHLYEREYPNDLRPRKAIEAARAGSTAADAAAYAAARAADAAAYAAAYAAARAADAAAYAATDAAYAAAYAATDAAAYAAYATNNRVSQHKLIRKIILRYWK